MEDKKLKDSIYCEQHELDDLKDIRELSLIKRIFRPMKNNSLRLGILNWLCCTLGAGILFLPFLFSKFGIINGIIILTINLLISRYSFYLYLKFSKISNKKNITEIIDYFLGKKFSVVTKYFFILLLFMAINIYILTAWKFLENFIENFLIKILNIHFIKFEKINIDGNLIFNEYGKNVFTVRIIYCVIALVILFPLSLKKNLNGLKLFTFIFLGFLFYTIFVFLGQAYSFYTYNKNLIPGELHFKYFKTPNLYWLNYYDAMIISFFCHSNCFQIWEEILNPSERRCKKIVNISLTIEYIIYLIIGIVGYLALGDKNMVQIISLRKNFNGESNDLLMIIGNFFYGIGMIIGAAFFLPIISGEIRKNFNLNDSFKNMLISGFIPIILSVIICLFLPNIMAYISITGGLLCNFLGYLLPIIIEILGLKFQKKRNYLKIILNFLLLCFLVFLMTGSFFEEKN